MEFVSLQYFVPEKVKTRGSHSEWQPIRRRMCNLGESGIIRSLSVIYRPHNGVI